MHARFQTAVPSGCPLSNRQFHAMSLLCRGMKYKEIAASMGVEVSTVNSHLKEAYGALGVTGHGIAEAIVIMKDSGWHGAFPRPPQRHDDSQDVTPVQLAYNACFVALCRERTPRAASIVTVAWGLLSSYQGLPSRPRRPSDIDELLLRMARGLRRPVYDGLD